MQQRTGSSGWVDPIWTFALGLVGAGSALSPDYPWSPATLLAPIFMDWILIYVTGIPPLEAQMLRSRGDRYRNYQSLPPQA